MTKTITVTCRRADPAAFGVQKYSNQASWNAPGEIAPNGVSATRYLRRTSPDVTRLSPLASFLVRHAPSCVAGNFPAFNVAARIRCYNGKSEAQTIRERAAQPDHAGRYWANNMWFLDPGKAATAAENIIRCYGLEGKEAQIDDWHFSIIGPSQSDESYWDQEAARMIAAGTVRVRIGDAELNV